MPKVLKLVTSVASGGEAEIIHQLLLEQGIQSIVQRNIGGPEFGPSGGQSVFVDEADLERARTALAADVTAIDEDELARLSEQAGRDANAERDQQ